MSTPARPRREAVEASLEHLIALHRHGRGLLPSAGRRVGTLMAGQRRSLFRGRGVDFDEVRAYQAGDDIRAMEWRVTARTGRPHTRLYHEERERPVFFLVDHSPEMHFATRGRFKSVIAAEAAALLAWDAAGRGDRVGAIVFNGDAHREARPRGGRRGVLQMLRMVVEIPRARRTDPVSVNHALARLRRVARPGSLIVVLSDFRHFDEGGERHLAHLARHNDLLPFLIHDRLERELPPPGLYPVADGHGGRFWLDSRPRRHRRAHRERFEARRQAVARLFGRHGVALLELSSEDDVVEALRRQLGGRG